MSLHHNAPSAFRTNVGIRRLVAGWRPVPRPKKAFCGFTVTEQFARRPRVLRLLPSAAKGGA